MPGKSSVVVRFIGDTTGLDRAMGRAESNLGKTGAAFSRIGSTIGGEFGMLVSQVGDDLARVGEKGKNLGIGLGVAGGAALAAGVELMKLGSGPKQAMDQLSQAITDSGGSISDYRDQIDKAIKTQENFGHSETDTANALQTLTQATNSPKAALAEMGLVANLAAARHTSLADAAAMLAKVIAGRGQRTLSQYGITATKVAVTLTTLQSAERAHASAIDHLATAQQNLIDKEALLHGKRKLTLADSISLRKLHEAVARAQQKLTDSTKTLTSDQQALNNPLEANKGTLDLLAKKLNGQAAASVNNFGSKIDIVKTKLGDWAAKMGNTVGPALTAIGPVMMGAGAIIESGALKAGASWVASSARTLAAAVASAAGTVVAWTASTAETIALGGMLLMDWIRKQVMMAAASVSSALAAAAGWVVANLAMIAASGGILLAIGAIVLGALWLKKHWREVWTKIKQWAADAWNWISDHWRLILEILTGPIGLAVVWIVDHWDTVKRMFGKAVSFIGGVFAGVVGVITSPFRAAFNAVADLWNSTIGGFSTPAINLGPIHIPSLSMPMMPHLASGGIVTRPTMALIGEAGPEAVVPLGRGGGMGGTAVHIHMPPGTILAGTSAELARAITQILQRAQGNAGLQLGFL